MGQFGPGFLMQHTRSERRVILADAVLQCDGKLVHTAHELGYSRSHLYRLIDEHRLWPLINKVRAERLQRERAQRRRDF